MLQGINWEFHEHLLYLDMYVPIFASVSLYNTTSIRMRFNLIICYIFYRVAVSS